MKLPIYHDIMIKEKMNFDHSGFLIAYGICRNIRTNLECYITRSNEARNSAVKKKKKKARQHMSVVIICIYDSMDWMLKTT